MASKIEPDLFNTIMPAFLNRPLSLLLLVIGIGITIVSCGGNSSDPDFDDLELINIIPDSGMVGDSVIIEGSDVFDSKLPEHTLTFNGTRAYVLNKKSNRLTTKVPKGATSGQITLEIDDEIIIGPHFKVLTHKPAITGVSPAQAAPGTKIRIKGEHFLSGSTSKDQSSEKILSDNKPTEEKLAKRNTPNTLTLGTGGAKRPGLGIPSSKPDISRSANPPSQKVLSTQKKTPALATTSDADAISITIGGQQAPVLSASDTLLVTEVPEGASGNIIEVILGEESAVWDTFQLLAPLTITSSPSFNIKENSKTVGTVVTTDSDGNILTFNLSAGDDRDQFSIDEKSGVISFNTAPDYETPTDANNDNIYQLQVQVSDGKLTATQDLSISVQNINDVTPTITSSNTMTITENTSLVGTVVASDSDGDNLTYSVLSGTKGTLTFGIDSNSGEITISPAPDFETPRDNNRDNTYEVDINVSDGVQSTTQQVNITVSNLVEVPNIDRGTISISHSQNYSLNSTNQDNVFKFDAVPAGTDLSNIQNFSLGTSLSADLAKSATVTGGADGGVFSVNSLNVYAIHLDGPSSLDYNHSADGNAHEYRFTITAENAAGVTQPYTIIIPVQPFAGGSGTATDPYQVETIDQLQIANKFLDAHFVQTTDIDASATSGWNGGQGFKPIGDFNEGFSGSYDGGGHTIDGLTMDRTQSTIYGLFGIVSSGGQISNVRLNNIDITTDDTAGGLAAINQGTITDSYVSGTINSSTNGTTGGLVGENNGVIRRSYSLANVNGRANVGGLVGTNYFGTITNSYATGNVYASYTIAGGLVGNNKSVVEHSYATGAVSAGSTAGGLVGYNVGTTTDNYWDTQSTGQSSSEGGTGLTTSQMQGAAAQTNMTGFDFSNIWQTNTGDYPALLSNP